jgi:hypothetical protein
MMTHTDRRTPPTLSSRWTVVVVSEYPVQRVLDAVIDSPDCDVVLVDSFARAYSEVRNLAPQIVIVCLEVDDPEGSRVLSMLHLDSATSRIPVVTYLMGDDNDEPRGGRSVLERELGRHSTAGVMN